MNGQAEGFYSAYVTGKEGQGFALLIFMAGRVVGADAGGFLFDGEYVEGGDGLSVSLSIKAPRNAPRVQGGLTGPEGEEDFLNFHLPQDFASKAFVRIDTQHGPVNVKLVRLRGISE
jgi:hypothetical protein